MLLKLRGGPSGRLPISEDDHRPDDRPAFVVGRRHGGGFRHGRVRDQRGLDLEGPHAVARGDDDVVVAALEPEVAVVVPADLIPGPPPLAVEWLLAQVVAEEGGDRLGAHLQLAAHHTRLDSRQGAAHGAVVGGVVLIGAHSGHRTGLGLAVAVADRQPHLAAEDADHLRVERFARRDHAPERSDRPQLGPLGEHPVLRRGLAEDVDALPFDQLESLGRIEAPVVDQGRGAASHGAMKALRVDFDHPGAAVHQARSPFRAPTQCSACRPWPVR